MNNSPKIEDVFPLSDIARGMVYHSVKDTGANIYHDQTFFRMRVESYDFARFQKAMSLLVCTHENLRSYFDLFGREQPLQIVCEDMPATIERIDLSDVVEADQPARIQTILGDDRRKPFDFSQATRCGGCTWSSWGRNATVLFG